MNLRTRSREEPEINLTSLIDVVLLLLVFFMITTSFVRESKIGIRLPEASSTAKVDTRDEALVIAVTAQGTYLVNGRALMDARPQTLAAAIKQLAGDSPGTRVTISADAGATHQAVITAMDVAGRAGYIEVNLATVEAEGE